MKPALSIIVPVFRAEEYIRECVNSILASDFNDFELILVDDCSPDASGKICDDIAADCPCVRVLHQPARGGVSKARNIGMNYASADWITFVDADDLVMPDFFSNLMREVERDPETDFVQAGCTYYRQGRPAGIAQEYKYNSGTDPAYLLKNFRGLTFSKLFKTEILNNWKDGCPLRFDEHIPTAEDMAFTLDYIFSVRKYVFIPERGYLYRQDNTQSITHLNRPVDYDRAYHAAVRMNESLNDYRDRYGISDEDCQLRFAQRGIGFFSAIASLYKNNLPRDERIKHIKEDYSDDMIGLIRVSIPLEPSKVRRFLSRLFCLRRPAIFDFSAFVCYKVKAIVSKF